MVSYIKKGKKAFTLIELLVVVAIIGVLSSIVISSLNSAREKARDMRRVSDLRQIKIALESFYADNGYYPPSSCGWDCNGYSASYGGSWDTLSNYLLPYISILPKDPINDSCVPYTTTSECHSYIYGNVTRYNYDPQYDLTALFEDKNNSLRCELKNYKFFFNNNYLWCGTYSKYIYEAS